MATIYYPIGAKIIERNTISGSQVVQLIDCLPDSIFYFQPNGAGTSSLTVDSSSYAGMTSYSNYAVTASCLLGYSDILNPVITSSYAISASYALNLPHIEKGVISGSSFGGFPQTYNINFSMPFLNTIYIVSIIGEDARLWTANNLTTSSFTISTNSNQTLSGMVMWRVEQT